MEYQKFIPEGWQKDDFYATEDDVEKAMEDGRIITGKVITCDSNYNLHVNFNNNLKGIIPREEVEAMNVEETGFPKPNICMSKVNKYVQCKVKDIDKEGIVILSRKEVGREALDWAVNELQEGQVVKGIVKNIRPYGAFVEIGGGVVGLLRIEDISVARIKSPAERLKVEDKINVMIKHIDKQKERILLTYKELLGTWEENASKFKEGMIVKGIIRETEKAKNGIFIELQPNLVGMAEYTRNFKYGQQVDVYIKKIIPEKKKIKLTLIDEKNYKGNYILE